MALDPKKTYSAVFKMAKGGEFTIQLHSDKAPITVNSFVFLAREGYFDGVTFHRVLEGFMAQGGDPTGTGAGGPGYQFVNEDSDLSFDKPGVVAMANAGRDTNGSQFFITFVPTSLPERRLHHLRAGDRGHGCGQRHHPPRSAEPAEFHRRCDRIGHDYRKIIPNRKRQRLPNMPENTIEIKEVSSISGLKEFINFPFDVIHRETLTGCQRCARMT